MGWLGQRTQLRDSFEQELFRKGDPYTVVLIETPQKFAFSFQL